VIIGFTGVKQSGKDTAASFLVDELGFERHGFADKLKEAVANLFGISIEEVDEFKAIGVDNIAIVEVFLTQRNRQTDWVFPWREFLQRFGTEMGRNTFGQNFWVSLLLPKDVKPVRNIVISDVRFDNEAMRIISLGGKVFEIVRPKYEPDGHASEEPISRSFVDAQIINDGTLEEFKNKVLGAISSGDAG